jgi:hypothetical protein
MALHAPLNSKCKTDNSKRQASLTGFASPVYNLQLLGVARFCIVSLEFAIALAV